MKYELLNFKFSGVCTVLYIGVSAAVTLMVPYYELNENAAISDSFNKIKLYPMATFVAVNAFITLSGIYLIFLFILCSCFSACCVKLHFLVLFHFLFEIMI